MNIFEHGAPKQDTTEFATNTDNTNTRSASSDDSAIESGAYTDRILVALDASPQSLAALGAAATMARLLHAELCGIFVEDQELEALCSLPFSAEVGAYSATARTLSNFCINREFRALAEGLQLILKNVAQVAGVPWSMRVVRGGVSDELLSAAYQVSMISLGRIGWSQRNEMGSTASTLMQRTRQPLLLPGITHGKRHHQNGLGEKGPRQRIPAQSSVNEVKVIYTGTAAADRALSLALRLSKGSSHPMKVYVVNEPLDESDERNMAFSHAQVVPLSQRGTSHILNMLHEHPGITLLPDVDAHLTVSLTNAIADPIVLVS